MESTTGPEVILNSAEYEIYPAHKYQIQHLRDLMQDKNLFFGSLVFICS